MESQNESSVEVLRPVTESSPVNTAFIKTIYAEERKAKRDSQLGQMKSPRDDHYKVVKRFDENSFKGNESVA